jgi:NADH:ubiquinone oxidoreductase subunit 6 (subunit J)
MRRLLLALSLLASAVSIAFAVLAVQWRHGRSAGPGAPSGIEALAFPLALLLFLVFEVPAVTVVLALWRAYLTVRRRPG